MKFLPNFGNLRVDHILTICLNRMIGIIVLMIVFGDIKYLLGSKFSHDREFEYFFPLKSIYVFSSSFEFITRSEYHTSILLSRIGSLSISTRRIMCCEEDIEEGLIRDLRWLIGNFDDLDILTHTRTHSLIGRVWDTPSHVSRSYFEDSLETTIDSIETPETASTKIGFLEVRDSELLEKGAVYLIYSRLRIGAENFRNPNPPITS